MAKERFESNGSETYVDAPIKIGLFPLFMIYLLGSIALISYILKMTGGEDGRASMFPLFPLLFIVVFFAPVLYNLKKSIFEKTRKVLKTRIGGGSIGLFQGTAPFFKMLIYDDAIEVKVFFHSYLIPYDRMEEAPHTVGTLFRGLIIRSDLPGVPAKINFAGLSAEEIGEITGRYQLARNGAHGSRAGQPEDGISNAIADETTRQKRISAQIKTLAIRMFFIIFLAEIIALFGFGFIYRNLMIMNNTNKQDVKIFKYNEYTPISERAAGKYNTAIVEYDSVGVVKKETFINLLGDAVVIKYEDGKVVRSSWIGYSNIVMVAFPILGFFLLPLSSLLGAGILRRRSDGRSTLRFADKLQICGMVLFFSVFIFAPLRMVLIDYLILGIR
jgi:hypothetical protein